MLVSTVCALEPQVAATASGTTTALAAAAARRLGRLTRTACMRLAQLTPFPSIPSPHTQPLSGARLQARGGEEAGQQKGRAGAPTPRPCVAPFHPTHHLAHLDPPLEPPPIPAHLELPLVYVGASPFIPKIQLLSYLGPWSLRSAQQIRHEQEGPGSGGAEQDGAAGAPGVPSSWPDKHRVAHTTRILQVQPHLMSHARMTSARGRREVLARWHSCTSAASPTSQ